MVNIKRFDIFLIELDPTKGSEINKTRPCLVVSPNEMNYSIKTFIVAPMTTKGKNYPTRVSVLFAKKEGIEARGDKLLLEPKIIELIKLEIKNFTSQAKNYEIPKSFLLVEEEWTVDNGLLTPTLKIKRRDVVTKYKKEIDQFYL